MIISSLVQIKNNLFFISTHILEVAENINSKDSIIFKCFESELINEQPIYDFRIKEGVSKKRVPRSLRYHRSLRPYVIVVLTAPVHTIHFY